MAVTFYPNQKITVAGNELTLVQSANVDFSIKRQEVFEFGSQYAIDYVQTDAATVNLNFEYALNSGNTTNLSRLGLNSIGDIISDTTGKQYIITSAGSLTIPSGVINNYSIKAAVGSIPTVSVGVVALDAQYSAGSPASARSATTATPVTPQAINLKAAGTEVVCRNASLSLDIPRQYVYKLGSLTPIATITNGAAKVTAEAEVILDTYEIDNPNPGDITITIGGSASYTAKNLKLTSFNPKNTLNEVAIATVRWEGIITNSSDLTLGG